jgi:hypothetical protein
VRTFIIIMSLSLLATTTGFAADHRDVAWLDVYYDEAFESDEPSHYLPSNVPIDLYIVLADPQVAAIGGFEFGWRITNVAEGMLITGVDLPPGAMNIGTTTNLIVGLAVPLVTTEMTLLATVTVVFVVESPSQGYVGLGPATPATLPGHAAYNNFHNPAEIRPIELALVDTPQAHIDASGWTVPGAARLFPICIPVEETTWGAIKATFRD